MLIPQPTCDLLRRPVLLEFTRYDPPQRWAPGEHTGLGSACRIPSHLVGVSGPIAFSASVPSEFLADRGDRSMKASGDGAQCVTGGDTSGNLFTLAEARYSRCTTAVRGAIPPEACRTRWRCREPSRQLYIGARVLRVLSLEFLMTSPVPGESLFTRIRAGGAYDHDTATPLPRDQSSQAAVMERRTKTSSRAIPGEAASLSERRARKASFSARRRASDSMLMITKSPERDPLIPK